MRVVLGIEKNGGIVVGSWYFQTVSRSPSTHYLSNPPPNNWPHQMQRYPILLPTILRDTGAWSEEVWEREMGVGVGFWVWRLGGKGENGDRLGVW